MKGVSLIGSSLPPPSNARRRRVRPEDALLTSERWPRATRSSREESCRRWRSSAGWPRIKLRHSYVTSWPGWMQAGKTTRHPRMRPRRRPRAAALGPLRGHRRSLPGLGCPSGLRDGCIRRRLRPSKAPRPPSPRRQSPPPPSPIQRSLSPPSPPRRSPPPPSPPPPLPPRGHRGGGIPPRTAPCTRQRRAESIRGRKRRSP